MKIVLVAVGSRGDVQPYVGLGLGLRRAGHDVVIATHGSFAAFVQSRGLAFRSTRGADPREMLAGEAGHAWLESGHNPVRFIRRLKEMTGSLMDEFLAGCYEAALDADAIIFSALGYTAAAAAETTGVPCAGAYLQPNIRTRAFPHMLMPNLPAGSGALNLASHLIAEQVFWQPMRAATNRFRASVGLDPFPLLGPFARIERERLPILFGYSPIVVPPPADWGEWLQVTGYWFLDSPADWEPPSELSDFLASGPPPVYIGFGSMTARDPAALTELAVTALRRARQRGVLLAGWSGLGQRDLPEDVCLVHDIPHDWLFPRMAAVVHHGGAGTTAAGLRAGVPSIVTPVFADQPFWGKRIASLGVGPRPIPRAQLTVERLGAAIERATTDRPMRARAAAIGERIRAEDGIGNAVAAFERIAAAGASP